jgi:ketosteroid isomerase-like protein
VAQEAFMETFRACYLGDDLDTFMQLMDEGAVWTFMATGETFKGREQIREAAEKSMAGRIHTKALHMELKNLFASDDMVCIEYLHRATVPEHATITGSPPAGAEIAVPICITMRIKNGKICTFNEYLDLATFGGAKKKLFA